MATYYDEHADLGLVQARRVAVVGAGHAALVHANALRDAGVDVRIGAPPDAGVRGDAEMAGHEVAEPLEAVRGSSLVACVDDTALGRADTADHPPIAWLEPGAAVVVTDALALRFGDPAIPPGRDVVLVEPLAGPMQVERELAAGRGVPVLVAVHVDASGDALDLGLSYAKALGGTRAGAIGTTVSAVAETTLFGAYGVGGPAVEGIVRAGFDVLVEAGYPREQAYLACVQSVQRAVAGLAGDAPESGAGPNLTEYARLVGGAAIIDEHVREQLRRALRQVREGELAKEAERDRALGSPRVTRLREQRDRHALTAVGRRVRRLMPWIAERGDARHAR